MYIITYFERDYPMKTKLTRRIFLTALCCILYTLVPMTAFAGEENNITEMSATGTLTTSALNVRSGPSKSYEAIGKVSSSDTIIITGQASTGWYRIDFNGQDGYISDAYVTINEGGAVDEANTFTDYIEEKESKPLNTRLLIIIGIIAAVIVAIIITMIVMFRSPVDDDEYEDEDEPEEEEEDVDLIRDEIRGEPKKPTPAGPQRKKLRVKSPETPSGKPQSAHAGKTPTPQNPAARTDVPMQESTTVVRGDDYRIYIDPRYFDDDTPPNAEPEPETGRTDSELDAAMQKLNELQQEIERLKRQKDSQNQ